ncbi:MAG: Rieske 2Fe-2S domain-containing protein [Acidobacteria bacterium]|nr:Rieske 2Fe-2S domain-containing protein [Acidobacteriota bacterium]
MSWLKLFPVSELPMGYSRSFQHEQLGVEVGIFHTPDGLFAIENTCPHHEASLSDGPVKQGVVYCPMHFWRFRLQDGFCFTGPQFHLKTYAIEIREGHVWLNTVGLVLDQPPSSPV